MDKFDYRVVMRLRMEEKFKEAQEYLDKFPNETETLLSKAKQHIKEKQYDEAIKLYRKIIDNGDSSGYVELYKFYKDNQYGRKNEQLAKEYLELAASLDNLDGLFFLGNVYAKEKRYREAVECYTRAAEKGDSDCSGLLGYYYKHGNLNLEINDDTAIFWLEKAAEQGDSFSVDELEDYYNNGKYSLKKLKEIYINNMRFFDDALHERDIAIIRYEHEKEMKLAPKKNKRKNMPKEQYDVFISYSSLEYDKANIIRNVLERNGIKCWMAPESIPSGSNYAIEIPKAIKNSKIILLILSENAQKSKWVPKEIDVAINNNKIIKPLEIEECELIAPFDFYLSNVQRYKAYDKLQQNLEIIVKEIKSILNVIESREV